MNASEREQMLERRVIHPATYLIRHDSGECFEVVASAVKFLSGKDEQPANDDVPF